MESAEAGEKSGPELLSILGSDKSRGQPAIYQSLCERGGRGKRECRRAGNDESTIAFPIASDAASARARARIGIRRAASPIRALLPFVICVFRGRGEKKKTRFRRRAGNLAGRLRGPSTMSGRNR